MHLSQEASLNVDSATDDAPGTKFITSQGPLHRAVEGFNEALNCLNSAGFSDLAG